MEISDYEQYYQKGGTYVLPIEVFNELWGEMENWKDTCKQKENIIKELEKWLKDYIKLFDKPDMLEEQTLEDLKEVLDKLQELKGDSSNE